MVTISKIQLSPNVKKLEKISSKPKVLNIIQLARFSGAEAAEKSTTSLKNTQTCLSLFQLQQKLKESKEAFKEIVKKSFSNLTISGESVILDLKENVTQSVLNQLKNIRLLHKNNLKEISTLFSNNAKIPYTNMLCSDIPEKQFFTHINESVIMSPRLMVHYIKGENTASHNRNVNDLKKIYGSCSINELLNMKKKILNEFCEYTNTDCLIPDYRFSKAKIKRLKLLTEKYDAIDDLLKKHNIHTSAIEALFYSGIEKCSKAGDILPNKDIMLGFSSVYDRNLKKDIPTILSFANTDVGYRFKAYRYDENFISNIEKYKKQVAHYINTKNYKCINDLNNKILDYLKTISVSEVYVELKDIEGLRNEMKKCPDMTEEKIEQVLKNSKNNTVYYINYLKNYDIKRYYNVSIPMIKCLKMFGKINNIDEAYIEALAFNNVKHSPIGMYIRNGFEPISIPKEEIEKELYSKAGFDYKRLVWLVYKL